MINVYIIPHAPSMPMSSSSVRPTIYLGKITVNDGEVNFNDSNVTVAHPVNGSSATTKSYVDDAVKVQKDRIDGVLNILDGAEVNFEKLKNIATLEAAITTVAERVTSVINDRVAGEASLQKKIDMLFQVFFHRSSEGATIDSNHQLSFN